MKKCIIIFFILTGCSMFKNTTKTADEQHLSTEHQSSLNLKEQKDWSKNTSSLLFYKDSSNRDQLVQIWPKGVFTYSADKGYYGEADSMLISGSSREGSTGAQSEHISELDKGQTVLKSNTKDQLVSDQNRNMITETVSWKIVIASVMIIGLIIWFVFKK